MPDTPTPGETAYAAYWQHTQQMLRGHPWETLPPTEQAHWEAAAQAVLDAARDTPQPTVLDLYEAMGEVRHGPQGTRPP